MSVTLGSTSGRTIFESLLVVTLISLLMGGTGFEIQRVDRRVRETALKWELRNLRAAISLFSFMNSRVPLSLREVHERGFVEPFRRDVRLGAVTAEPARLRLRSLISLDVIQEMGIDEAGNILDPFGNPYVFDPESGRLYTTTEEYTRW
ncbi:MAG: hypothetical protein HYT87_10825 [Nitrospirae bacterium]|nr:hypothetical protein [Nitrospirota bacterium]